MKRDSVSFLLAPAYFMFTIFLLAGCGGSSDSDSYNTKDGQFVHERDFAANSDLYALPEQRIALYLEPSTQSGPLEEDTGGIGDDLIKIRFPQKTGHEFKLEVPEGDLFTMTVTGPDGNILAMLNKDNPAATVDIKDGIHSLAITHGGGTDRNRCLFIREGSTIVSKDCPGCVLAGADLPSHNLSGADLTGTDISGASLAHADLSYVSLKDADTTGTDFTNADVTGTLSPCYTPTDQPVTPVPDNKAYFLAPQASPCTGNKNSYSIISLVPEPNTNPGCTPVEVDGGNSKWVELSPGYWIVTVKDSVTNQPLKCLIKTTNGSWEKVDPKTVSSVSGAKDLTQGCQYIPDHTSNNINVACIPPDYYKTYFSAVYLLDKRNGNLLYRGETPNPEQQPTGQDPYTYLYDDLMGALKARYKTQVTGGTFPTKFNFIEISLLDNTGNWDMVKKEYEFFGGGTGTDPQAYPATQPPGDTYQTLPIPTTIENAHISGQFRWRWRKTCPGEIPDDNTGLANLLDEIDELMNSKEETPNVVFFHCNSGMDRTGEVAISYMLHARGYDPEKAYVYGTTYFRFNGPGGSAQRVRESPSHPYPAWLNCATSYCEFQNHSKAACDYNKVDQDSIPGSKDYPCPYPWSTCNPQPRP